MVMPLEAEHISKTFGDVSVLRDLSLQLRRQETLSILGRSGSGKTTLLKILAGLETPDRGTVTLRNADIQTLKPQDRDIVYLYQEALLFPHLTLFENIAFGLRLRSVEENEIRKHTSNMIERLELRGMANKMPHQLSGGEKQRTSFGRALITNPDILLLDEPFGHLDADTRQRMQQLFKTIARDFRITAVFVTHNVKEAILMGDRIAHLSCGTLTVFPTVEAFIRSDNDNLKEEIKFWESIADKR